jgi:hypothetical protein
MPSTKGWSRSMTRGRAPVHKHSFRYRTQVPSAAWDGRRQCRPVRSVLPPPQATATSHRHEPQPHARTYAIDTPVPHLNIGQCGPPGPLPLPRPAPLSPPCARPVRKPGACHPSYPSPQRRLTPSRSTTTPCSTPWPQPSPQAVTHKAGTRGDPPLNDVKVLKVVGDLDKVGDLPSRTKGTRRLLDTKDARSSLWTHQSTAGAPCGRS